MTRAHVFSDEAGCFAFARNERASRYFLVCTVAVDDCNIGDSLQALRRDMVWRGIPVREEFHATEDVNPVREEVYAFLAKQSFRVDVTLLEKAKAQPQTRQSNDRFHKYAWFYHFKHVGPRLLQGKTELMITAAALGTKKGQAVYTAAVNEILQQIVQRQQWRTFFPRSVADPCLQVADYCAWAAQRKWEKNDTRWHDLIKDKVETEFDLWRNGNTLYY